MKKTTVKQKLQSDRKALINSRAPKKIGIYSDKTKAIKKIEKQKKQKITAPNNFSLKQNTNLVLDFFNKLDRAIDKKHFVRLDLSNITNLTVDTLIYFITCLERYGYNDKDYRIQTKNPRDKELKQVMVKSGLLEFSKEKQFIKDEDIIQIHYGDKDNRELIKKICDFVAKKFEIPTRIYTKDLARILGELMLNTVEHAYHTNNDTHILKNWYLYCSYDSTQGNVELVFMDTGQSIPKTINKRLFEKIPLIGMTPTDLLLSALNGEYRSRTRKKYRGLGLQALTTLEKKQYIQNLSVLSHKGRYGILQREKTNKLSEIKGTIINFKICKGAVFNEK